MMTNNILWLTMFLKTSHVRLKLFSFIYCYLFTDSKSFFFFLGGGGGGGGAGDKENPYLIK